MDLMINAVVPLTSVMASLPQFRLFKFNNRLFFSIAAIRSVRISLVPQSAPVDRGAQFDWLIPGEYSLADHFP